MASFAELLKARQKATEGLGRLYEVAVEVAELHDRAQMPMPDEVRWLLSGVGEAITKAGTATTTAASPSQRFEPSGWNHPIPSCPFVAPSDAGEGWVSIAPGSALLATLTQFVIGPTRDYVPSKEIIQRVRERRSKLAPGSIWNTGARLRQAGVLEGNDDGWRLTRPDTAPTESADGRIWAAPDILLPVELASHRRDALVALLRTAGGRARRAELLAGLRLIPWLHAPINVHLIKADLQAMEAEGLVTKDNATWEWRLVEKGQAKLKLA